MDKIFGSSGKRGGKNQRFIEKRLETDELGIWEGVEKRLEDNDGLAEAGVQVVMNGIEKFPLKVGADGIAGSQFIGGRLEAGVEFVDEIGERGDFVIKLRPAGEKNPAEKIVEQRDALAAGMLKIIGVERSKIRCDAEMFGMFEHHEKHGAERMGEPLTQGRRNRKDLVRLGDPAVLTQTKSFVESNTEHGVGGFEATNIIEVDFRFLALQGYTPILRHRSFVHCDRAVTHGVPPQSARTKYSKFMKNR